MKLNWGTGIVIAFTLFIGFILFFVVKMTTDHKANHDLVTEEYYYDELNYQEQINAQQNAHTLTDQVVISKNKEGITIAFPYIKESDISNGTVSLYRPSNRQLDIDFPMSLSNSHMLIPDNRLLGGRWDIKIAWRMNNKNYLVKESITY